MKKLRASTAVFVLASILILSMGRPPHHGKARRRGRSESGRGRRAAGGGEARNPYARTYGGTAPRSGYTVARTNAHRHHVHRQSFESPAEGGAIACMFEERRRHEGEGWCRLVCGCHGERWPPGPAVAAHERRLDDRISRRQVETGPHAEHEEPCPQREFDQDKANSLLDVRTRRTVYSTRPVWIGGMLPAGGCDQTASDSRST